MKQSKFYSKEHDGGWLLFITFSIFFFVAFCLCILENRTDIRTSYLLNGYSANFAEPIDIKVDWDRVKDECKTEIRKEIEYENVLIEREQEKNQDKA